MAITLTTGSTLSVAKTYAAPLNFTAASNAATPMGAQAEALYQAFSNLGGAAKDFSGIIKLLDGSWRA